MDVSKFHFSVTMLFCEYTKVLLNHSYNNGQIGGSRVPSWVEYVFKSQHVALRRVFAIVVAAIIVSTFVSGLSTFQLSKINESGNFRTPTESNGNREIGCGLSLPFPAK